MSMTDPLADMFTRIRISLPVVKLTVSWCSSMKRLAMANL